MNANIKTPATATFTLTRLMGGYPSADPRKAALSASTIIALRGTPNEIIRERRGRRVTFVVVDDRGMGVRYYKG